MMPREKLRVFLIFVGFVFGIYGVSVVFTKNADVLADDVSQLRVARVERRISSAIPGAVPKAVGFCFIAAGAAAFIGASIAKER